MSQRKSLEIIYKEYPYSWSDLCQKINELPPEPSGIIPAQHCFSSVLYILHGFISKTSVFPLSDEQINNKLLIEKFYKHNKECTKKCSKR